MKLAELNGICYMEECGEATKAMSKLLRRGPDYVYEGDTARNHLKAETIDIMCAYALLVRLKLVDSITEADVRKALADKAGKMLYNLERTALDNDGDEVQRLIEWLKERQ